MRFRILKKHPGKKLNNFSSLSIIAHDFTTINLNNWKVEKLCPSSESGSRFGSAIASLGDIDHDGFIGN